MPELVPPGWIKMQYQNPAETFLSAYFAATQVNAKRQQMENAMAKLGLENERINLQRDLGEKRLEFQIESAERRAQIAEGTLGIRREHEAFSEDKFNSTVQDMSGLGQDIASMKSKPGDPSYISELNDIYSRHPMAEMHPSGRQFLKTSQTIHNKAIDSNKRSIDSDEKALNNELKADRIPTRILNNPQIWEDKWVDKNDKLVPEGTKGATKKTFFSVGIKDELDPKVVGGIKKVTDYTTVPRSKLEQYQKRYQDIQQRRGMLPEQVSDSSTGVTPTVSSSSKTVRIVTPDGRTGVIPTEKLQDAIDRGAKQLQ